MNAQDILNKNTVNTGGQPKKKGFFARVASGFLVLMVVLMGLGNWADTKQLLTEGYQAFITHFTHQIEDKRVAALDIGNYLEFVQQSVGIPQVIKTSNLDPNIEYRYYKDPKYLLTLINKEQRIVGIVLHSLQHENPLLAEFTPAVPFTDHLLKANTIADITADSNLFFYDYQNVSYYLQSKELGAQGMYLNLLAGFTEYEQVQTNATLTLNELEHATLEDNSAEVSQLTQKLAAYTANFYGISEISPQYIADSLLTKYEFNAYF
ncbi:ETEC_3214 domain-containing protein [Pseudomonadota bacterium]|uniref:ETEC_3214 domain-containing protein n=1 Tax=unclassified Shewanella TaxID=196818 RepID=UPI000CCB6C67|nr:MULTISPECIES: ETEC_3214 domain-containing protein [unclassified Shewanella]MDO6677028.1 hypothetical protein [Shewanella sp. 4_MG-2023]PMG27561.1 hypothetical protein BCU94_04140 [Shewanella sp. 10N.286.52.C2]PMH86680.1 hypothetical protein BCU57_11150 [Shewanella sp. 10N.286.48.B5]PMH95133.1 hypothetical protein BCU55_02830 [Shewanella sp. 10N.286.48.A6]